jgi:molybdopterin molybdotransferase
VYALPALKKRLGFTEIHLPKMNRKINASFSNKTGKTLFLKGFYDNDCVSILESQSSAMLNTFAVANCFIYVPHTVLDIQKDQEVEIIPFN